MYEDIPKHNPFKTFLIVLIILVAFLGSGYFLYKSFAPQKSGQGSSPSPILRTSSPSPSPSSKNSPLASPSISPSPSATPNYQVPANESYVMSSAADTNGDKKEEILVITKQADGKYHAYVLSNDNKSLFDTKNMPQKPVRIATQTYDFAKESYLSWMLVFSENSGDLAFIHWNGSAYEIPQSLGL